MTINMSSGFICVFLFGLSYINSGLSLTFTSCMLNLTTVSSSLSLSSCTLDEGLWIQSAFIVRPANGDLKDVCDDSQTDPDGGCMTDITSEVIRQCATFSVCRIQTSNIESLMMKSGRCLNVTSGYSLIIVQYECMPHTNTLGRNLLSVSMTSPVTYRDIRDPLYLSTSSYPISWVKDNNHCRVGIPRDTGIRWQILDVRARTDGADQLCPFKLTIYNDLGSFQYNHCAQMNWNCVEFEIPPSDFFQYFDVVFNPALNASSEGLLWIFLNVTSNITDKPDGMNITCGSDLIPLPTVISTVKTTTPAALQTPIALATSTTITRTTNTSPRATIELAASTQTTTILATATTTTIPTTTKTTVPIASTTTVATTTITPTVKTSSLGNIENPTKSYTIISTLPTAVLSTSKVMPVELFNSTPENQVALIIGVTVAGSLVLFILLFILLTYYIVMQKNKEEKNSSEHSSLNPIRCCCNQKKNSVATLSSPTGCPAVSCAANDKASQDYSDSKMYTEIHTSPINQSHAFSNPITIDINTAKNAHGCSKDMHFKHNNNQNAQKGLIASFTLLNTKIKHENNAARFNPSFDDPHVYDQYFPSEAMTVSLEQSMNQERSLEPSQKSKKRQPTSVPRKPKHKSAISHNDIVNRQTVINDQSPMEFEATCSTIQLVNDFDDYANLGEQSEVTFA